MDTVIKIEQVSTGYPSRSGNQTVTSDLNASLNKGELVCLLGPNGAGKSTLMRTISGEQKPLEGKVYLEGKDIHAIPPKDLAKKLSLVLTERVHAGMLSAYEVVALGRFPYTSWSGRLQQEDHRIIREAIYLAGAEELAHKTLSELSDGERQKIMVARAFAQEPEVMILDEVTAFLDLPRRVEIMRLLRKMAQDSAKTILLSTHDMDLALRGADRIWLLPKGGQLHTGAPEDLVLDGSFEQAFESEGIRFDQQSGSFKISSTFETSVSLDGSGSQALWTRRALERNGINVDEGAEKRIEIRESQGHHSWIINEKDHQLVASSIHELITLLNSNKEQNHYSNT